MFSKTFYHDSRLIFYSKSISFFGTGLSRFIMPLFLYQVSDNKIHVGMQYAIFAIVQLISGELAARNHLFKNDRIAIVAYDVLLFFSMMIPFVFYNSNPILAIYVANILSTFFSAQQNGHLESLVGHAAIIENENRTAGNKARSYIIGITKSGENLGLFVGIGAAGILAHFFGFRTAFLIDAITFLLAAGLIFFVKQSGHTKGSPLASRTFSLIFSKKLFNLSTAQLFTTFATFSLNGTYIVVLKENFLATDAQINMTLTMQVAATLLASLIFTKLSKTKWLTDQWGLICRLLFVPTFISFSFCRSAWQFTAVFIVFHFIVALSLPYIMGMFQREVEKEELRALGIARFSITCISGAVAAFVSSLSLEYVGYENIYLFSSLMALIGAYFFWKHTGRALPKIVNRVLIER